MRFYFVDRIDDFDHRQISGSLQLSRTEYYGRPATAGLEDRTRATIAPGAISEAIGQLASWLAIAKNKFSKRPVFMFADAIRIHQNVKLGNRLRLEAEIIDSSGDQLRFSGRAYLNNQLVQEIVDCHTHLIDLKELEPPETAEQRFFKLLNTDSYNEQRSHRHFYRWDSLVEKTNDLKEGSSLWAHKTFSAQEDFYQDHFPNYPVTPIVMLNEMIGTAATRLFPNAAVNLKCVDQLKIKSFVRAEESCKLRLEKTANTGERVKIKATLFKDQKKNRNQTRPKPILRGLYEFQIKDQHHD